MNDRSGEEKGIAQQPVSGGGLSFVQQRADTGGGDHISVHHIFSDHFGGEAEPFPEDSENFGVPFAVFSETEIRSHEKAYGVERFQHRTQKFFGGEVHELIGKGQKDDPVDAKVIKPLLLFFPQQQTFIRSDPAKELSGQRIKKDRGGAQSVFPCIADGVPEYVAMSPVQAVKCADRCGRLSRQRFSE